MKKILCATAMLTILLTINVTAQDSKYVFDFIKNNPDRVAIKLVRNGEVLAAINPEKMMTLASTMKIIVAIEYAEQVAAGKIDPDEMIMLQEVDKYYLANTDGAAHPMWKAAITKDTKDERISIREIAKGMIKYSSNANTEWLLDKLGLENVNQRIEKLGVKNHEKINYLVSALLVGRHRFPDKKEEVLKIAIEDLSDEAYAKIITDIHNGLKSGTIPNNDIGDLSIPVQRVWSDRLPASTVAEYADIMQKINSRTYFSEKTHFYLDEVMEYILENPANRNWLDHAGMKGGSTAFVLTKALYATKKSGEKIELAYFLEDIKPAEYTNLMYGMNDFELKILINPEFRDKIRDEL
ncbi:MAG: serine hydrolase [Cyclobacteriaceae bacterium]